MPNQFCWLTNCTSFLSNGFASARSGLFTDEETAAKIDDKVVSLVRTQHEKARAILRENRQKLDEIAQFLYKKETITGEEFMEILNRN